MMYNRRFYIQLLGLFSLILFFSFAITKYNQKIPDEILLRVQSILTKNSLDWVAIRIEGRDIILSGLSPTIEEHNKAVELAKSIRAVRIVYDKISPIFISPYIMNIDYNGKVITLDGYMPSIKSKKKLFSKLKKISKYKNIDKVDIGFGEPVMWSKFIDIVISNIHKLDFASINIIDNRLYISGKIATEKELKTIEDSFKSLKNSQFIIINHIVAMDRQANICQAKFNKLLKKEKIEFESGTSVIRHNKRLIDELSNISLLCPEVNIEIIGYTDSVGDEDKNLKLSLERAQVVVSKLFRRGITLKRMIAKGRGEKYPISTNDSSYGRSKNRRIEFRVLKK